jgi:hypothetical protein
MTTSDGLAEDTSSVWGLNLTDDPTIQISGPEPSELPPVGAGVTTDLEGIFAWENQVLTDPSEFDDELTGSSAFIVFLEYTTIVDGAVNISTNVSSKGFFQFPVTLDENEPLGPIDARLWFSGMEGGRLGLAIHAATCQAPRRRFPDECDPGSRPLDFARRPGLQFQPPRNQ